MLLLQLNIPPKFKSHSLSLLSTFLFLDYIGYINDVSPEKTSKNSSRPYFDLKVKTSPIQMQTIRVMASNNTKRNLFVEKKIACQTVKITNLNPTKSGVAFYNANQGSRIQDTDTIDLKNDTNCDHKLINLKDKNSGLFTVCGTIKWTAEKKTVNVKGTDKTVREGILADDTFSIPISVWEDNLLSELYRNTNCTSSRLCQ